MLRPSAIGWRVSMVRICLSAFAASALALGFAVGAAQAQSRVFVAAQGSDTNPCTFALPCRTFQHAHDVVADNGEIDVLDPAGYGGITIAKSISIQGHGFAGISVVTGFGLLILAPASSVIHLNGLLIEGNGVGHEGIHFGSGQALVMENCVLHGFVETGIDFISSGTTTPTLSVSSSRFSSNRFAILTETSSSGGIMAAVERTVFYDNLMGLRVVGANGTGAINVAVTDSIVADGVAGSTGFFIQSIPGQSPVDVALTRTTATGNTIGVSAAMNATIRLSQATIVANGTGYNIGSGATIFSYGDNTIANNGGNTGTLTAATKQ
jgi:hypothetical protein